MYPSRRTASGYNPRVHRSSGSRIVEVVDGIREEDHSEITVVLFLLD